jgi:hypothetical protein
VKACADPVLQTALDPTSIAKRTAAFALLYMVVLRAWGWRTSGKTQNFRFLFPAIAERSVAFRLACALARSARIRRISAIAGDRSPGPVSATTGSAYKPIYKVRSYVKEKIRPRSMLAYNIVKFGTLGALILLLYIILR